jgi:DNA-binding NarL/FixJ family response regulator
MTGLKVVAVASNADDLARKIRAHPPQVAIVDLAWRPGGTALRACRPRASCDQSSLGKRASR